MTSSTSCSLARLDESDGLLLFRVSQMHDRRYQPRARTTTKRKVGVRRRVPPFQGLVHRRGGPYPGRCPGLSCFRPVGARNVPKGSNHGAKREHATRRAMRRRLPTEHARAADGVSMPPSVPSCLLPTVPSSHARLVLGRVGQVRRRSHANLPASAAKRGGM